MWLVMNIGCIECGVPSKVVGVFADEARAEDVAIACEKKYSWRHGGQNAFEVHKMPEANLVDDEYELGSNARVQPLP